MNSAKRIGRKRNQLLRRLLSVAQMKRGKNLTKSEKSVMDLFLKAINEHTYNESVKVL